VASNVYPSLEADPKQTPEKVGEFGPAA